MKVPTLNLYCKFVAIDKNNNSHEVLDTIITGCWEMSQHLEKIYGIKTVPSTVYKGKKQFKPLSYPYGRNKEYYLAYFNWVINFPKEQRAYFFENEIDMNKFYTNNPIVDFHLIIKKKI